VTPRQRPGADRSRCAGSTSTCCVSLPSTAAADILREQIVNHEPCP
jgi:hypothetical protein